MTVRVKICGITNVDDAQAAVAAGADALGFVFADGSPRRTSLAAAHEIIRSMPPLVSKVGVFVNASREVVREAIVACPLDAVQLHGDESPEWCLGFPVKVIKAFRIAGEESLAELSAYETDAWLLDSYVPGQMGGTGATFNWTLARRARAFGRPIILAGGLTPDNIANAVQLVEPFAVDVSSGVEVTPGRKHHAKMQAFISAAKRVAIAGSSRSDAVGSSGGL